MPRIIRVAAAQLGPIHLATAREEVLSRILKLLQAAAAKSIQLVVFPETALTTFFPRYRLEDVADADRFFDDGNTLLTSPRTRPIFDEARRLGLDVYLGFSEKSLADEGRQYNSCVYYSASENAIVARYRKIHLPGTLQAFEDKDAINQLEKLWFSPGDLGFSAFRVPGLLPQGSVAKAAEGLPADLAPGVNPGDPIMGMMICNDRRWPESWRCYGLQGVEMVLCGFNTTAWAPDLCAKVGMQTREEAEAEALYQHRLVMTGNSYMNSCFSISAAKAGSEEGKFELIGGSMIVSPDGYVLAEAKTKDDELISATIDLDECIPGKSMLFNFDRHRRIDQYTLVTTQRGVQMPGLL